MALHIRPDGAVDPDAFERETLTRLGMPREIVMRHRLPQFGHLFSSDAYSAGYYSYLWSETMDADTWAAFEETGNVWDPATAQRFAQHPALDRQRDRPGRSLSRVPRPRSGRRRAVQEARVPDGAGQDALSSGRTRAGLEDASRKGDTYFFAKRYASPFKPAPLPPAAACGRCSSTGRG